jgi:hypothetical protein
MLEAATAREQHRPETGASNPETTPVKVKKTRSRGLYYLRIERLERLERLEQWFYFDHSSICLVAC